MAVVQRQRRTGAARGAGHHVPGRKHHLIAQPVLIRLLRLQQCMTMVSRGKPNTAKFHGRLYCPLGNRSQHIHVQFHTVIITGFGPEVGIYLDNGLKSEIGNVKSSIEVAKQDGLGNGVVCCSN